MLSLGTILGTYATHVLKDLGCKSQSWSIRGPIEDDKRGLQGDGPKDRKPDSRIRLYAPETNIISFINYGVLDKAPRDIDARVLNTISEIGKWGAAGETEGLVLRVKLSSRDMLIVFLADLNR